VIFPFFLFQGVFKPFFRKKRWKTLWKLCKTQLFRDFYFLRGCGKLFASAPLGALARRPSVSVLASRSRAEILLHFPHFYAIMNMYIFARSEV
jgi:hypothetical protein